MQYVKPRQTLWPGAQCTSRPPRRSNERKTRPGYLYSSFADCKAHRVHIVYKVTSLSYASSSSSSTTSLCRALHPNHMINNRDQRRHRLTACTLDPFPENVVGVRGSRARVSLSFLRGTSTNCAQTSEWATNTMRRKSGSISHHFRVVLFVCDLGRRQWRRRRDAPRFAFTTRCTFTAHTNTLGWAGGKTDNHTNTKTHTSPHTCHAYSNYMHITYIRNDARMRVGRIYEWKITIWRPQRTARVCVVCREARRVVRRTCEWVIYGAKTVYPDVSVTSSNTHSWALMECRDRAALTAILMLIDGASDCMERASIAVVPLNAPRCWSHIVQ